MCFGLKKVGLLVFLLVVCMILSSAAVCASDDILSTKEDKIISEVEKTNQFVADAIDKASEKADRIAENILEKDKPQQEEKLDAAIDRIISHLIKTTDHKVSILLEKAAKENVEIVNEDIDVIIYDRTVSVDPCYAH